MAALSDLQIIFLSGTLGLCSVAFIFAGLGQILGGAR